MSADNYILIKENSKGKYQVSDRDYESNLENQRIGSFNTLRSAIQEAEKYISKSEIDVEYGIRFSLNKNK